MWRSVNMIWFACKQCGKAHSRPEAASGSLVFCACGQGNRVPWESTIEPPAAPPDRERPAPRAPEESSWPGRRRWREAEERDSAYCFNHQDVPAETSCADCGERFCPQCVVTVRGQTLCGPCKNYRIARMHRPARQSGLAVAALVLGLLSMPVTCCVSFGAMGMRQQSTVLGVIFGVGGVLLPLLGLVLGMMALRDVERGPRVSGRALAMTGTASAVLGVLWSLTVVFIMAGRHWVD